MKTTRFLTALLAASSLLAGCASIVNGPTQIVPITSDPSGAQVKVDNSPAGLTPTSVTLVRRDTHQITIEKEGYLPHSETLMRTESGWWWGDVLAFGLVGIIVDYSTGAIYKLNPGEVSWSLVKKLPTTPEPVASAAHDETHLPNPAAPSPQTGPTAPASDL